ncbi:glycosyltransferase involved in cell wall biosynthesis [Nocardia tenerifensis]|uniref:Glycosyltransferase involved in cell wall biosynthesis n=1 Tax=Nocardia tenerifensis TaxID=228006 RepID=A0A318JUR2_9NOCA|nr:glycosyltransferase [Nocardia tenerifensis]PXX57428.1 glycosyltransferase involved in cell wall biosynthesis [Nocardia tenerifensis]
MKIAMVSEHASPLVGLGGTTVTGQHIHVAELAAAYARRGHDVTVYTRRDGSALPSEVHTDAGYRVVHVTAGPAEPLPRDQSLPYLGDFGTFLQRQWGLDTPDIVHAHFWMSGLAGELAARAHGIPVVVTFHALGTVRRRHQGLADTSPRSRIRFERLIAGRAAHIVATSSDEVRELTRMGVPRFRISTVPSGIDLSAFTPEGPIADRGQRSRTHRVLSVGRLVPRKGFDIAIKALQELPDTELLIAGGPVGDDIEDDSEGRRLRRLAMDYGVQDRLRMLGHVRRAELPRWYRSADVVLTTPWYEPFGMVPLEAMACRKPVVATAVGGLLDTVVDGVTGRLVAPPDPLTIARAVRQLLDDPTLRDTWGAAGYQRAASRYAWDHIALETLTAYHRASPAHAGEVVSVQ